MTGSTTTTLRRYATSGLAIAIGAVFGANLRFLAIGSLTDAQGILLANVAGSTLLGYLVYRSADDPFGRHTTLLLTTGFCSSLTTYSGFAFGAATARAPALLLAIVLGNYVLAMVGVLFGRAIAKSRNASGSATEVTG